MSFPRCCAMTIKQHNLSDHGPLRTLPHHNWQNRTMFGYLSLLVQQFMYESIEINFLLVGHTHAFIDQYFSVLSNAISKAKFIGSPLSLMHLLETAHSLESSKRPLVVRKLNVYYDVATFLKPYTNDKIKVK